MGVNRQFFTEFGFVFCLLLVLGKPEHCGTRRLRWKHAAYKFTSI